MTRAEALAGAIASADQVAELTARKAELVAQLAGALRLERFAGRPIFEHGRVKTRCVGAGRVPDSSWRFQAELGNGESLSWPLFDVPPSLWPSMAATMRETAHGRATLAKLEAKESNNGY